MFLTLQSARILVFSTIQEDFDPTNFQTKLAHRVYRNASYINHRSDS